MNQYEIEKLNKAVERLTMENEALVDRIETYTATVTSLENNVEELTGKIWKLESEYALESGVIDTLRINEIDAWMINHETISQKIEKRILAKLKGE
jgi:predicted RNase H-like nuclease (RuvC/YqgF family)